MMSPGMTGIEALLTLREEHGPVPSRLITADRGAALQDLAAKAGIEILYKPIDPRALEAVVAQL